VQQAQRQQAQKQWEYRVASVDYRGRISVEGQETLIGNERRTAFLREFLDTLGAQGWELVSIQPLGQHDAYYIFKRPRVSLSESPTQPRSRESVQVSDDTLSTL
jgi:hypothetical protein